MTILSAHRAVSEVGNKSGPNAELTRHEASRPDTTGHMPRRVAQRGVSYPRPFAGCSRRGFVSRRQVGGNGKIMEGK